MKIAIISDSHDNLQNLNQALEKITSAGADVLFHLGDFCAPFIIKELDKLDIPVHCIFGNIDDRFSTTRVADSSKNVTLHGDVAELEFEGVSFALNHFPDIAKALAFSQKYDFVCHGHDHTQNKEEIQNTTLLNPGEIMGRIHTPSFAIVDTHDKSVSFIELE